MGTLGGQKGHKLGERKNAHWCKVWAQGVRVQDPQPIEAESLQAHDLCTGSNQGSSCRSHRKEGHMVASSCQQFFRTPSLQVGIHWDIYLVVCIPSSPKGQRPSRLVLNKTLTQRSRFPRKGNYTSDLENIFTLMASGAVHLTCSLSLSLC